jgi:quercetin dioxygenase-like cupin family protein
VASRPRDGRVRRDHWRRARRQRDQQASTLDRTPRRLLDPSVDKEVVVERFSFGSEVAFVPRGDLLDRVTMAPLTAPHKESQLVQAAIFRFAPGGRLLRHPGTYPQIIAVLEGSGEVSGADGVDEAIEAGEAVFLHEGEEHEMKSDVGLTVLIIEGESLDRFRGHPRAAP